MAEQPAANVGSDRDALVAEVEGQRQIKQDVIVVSGIERDPVERACRVDTTQHVECAVAVEGRDLDGDHVVDFRKAPPEIRAQQNAANRWLQVEADQRYLARDGLAIGDDLDLDGDHVVDFRKAPPEIRAQQNAANRWLQVEADQRYLARDGLAIGDDL